MSRLSRILSETGLALKKGLGQNFLVNQGALEKIATGSGCGPASFVLEIGSGLGNLTELLAREAGHVLAVELDERFRPLHERELGDLSNVEFLYGDFMELDLKALFQSDAEPQAETEKREICVVGNIPYHLTSPILFKLIESTVELDTICLLMQREVGQRLSAFHGRRDYGVLAAKARVRFDIKMLFTVSPGSFLPPPKVHSALVKLTPRKDGPLIDDPNRRDFFYRFVDAAFAQRRKILPKSLAAAGSGAIAREDVAAALEELDIDTSVRAEALSPEKLVALFTALGEPELPRMRRSYGE